jgi:glutamate N-acetyltransferase/amino-acid N-acetyltransferase
MSITPVSGGVCAPEGFLAAGVHSGITDNQDKKDLALIYSRARCEAACVYTKNIVQAAPLLLTKANLKDGGAQAIICNSGNANACTQGGGAAAARMAAAAAKYLKISEKDVIVASTGVIGKPLDAGLIESAMPRLNNALADSGSRDAVSAIMTTDTIPKEAAVSFNLGGKLCAIGAIAKGSGMIAPNMATMLAFITTDVHITSAMLQRALDLVIPLTLNMVSVDGDTSTNDMAAILANGMAGNSVIKSPGRDFDIFTKALGVICIYLSRLMAKDGEGATKLIECVVSGAADDNSAKRIAKSVVSSSLLKAAMFGADANWGRVLCAMGYSGGIFDPSRVKITLSSGAGGITVCEKGVAVKFCEDEAKKILSFDEIEITIELSEGRGGAVAWGCDLSYDYVKINGDYRS